MYYPYLRSKQNEMLALREIAQSTTIHYSHIIPIIEPVRELASLDKTIEAMEKAAIPYAIILNSNGYNAEDVYTWLAKEKPAVACRSFLSVCYLSYSASVLSLSSMNCMTVSTASSTSSSAAPTS